MSMVINDLQWKIGGEAGFGIMTTGIVFSGICARGGLKTFAYPEYPSLIRGGHNTYQVYVNEKHASSQIQNVHLLVALNHDTFGLHVDELVDGAAVVYDPEDFPDGEPTAEGKELVLVPVHMSKVVREMKIDLVARNMVGVGASFALLDFPFEHVEDAIQDWFGQKKPELADENIALAKYGYEEIAEKNKDFDYQLQAKKADPQMVISGNIATSMGAIQAGMKFYAAYPMTPSSGILGFLAKHENEFDLVVKQTEDELAAMNMVVGAGFTGVRSMTATSGGGFALMVEAFGMAGISEVPCVVVMGQRPGPSTGLPTWGSQGDLQFMLTASQGEFPRIVLTPGDPTECFYTTVEAFNLAEKYQVPVIILIDKYNQASWQSIEPFDTSTVEINRGKLLSQEELDAIVKKEGEYLRFKHTDDGVSPRAIPGMKDGRHLGTSYEHEEAGYTTEDEEETVKQNDKRFRKMEVYVEKDAKTPELFGPKDADVTLVGWGSTKLPVLQALQLAEAEKLSVNYLHFVHTFPLPVAAVQAVFSKTKKTLCIEGNKLGQLENLLKQDTDIQMDAHFRKYGGRPFYPEEIIQKVKELV